MTTPREPRSLQYHHAAGARPLPAGQVLKVGLIALMLGGLLNADSLYGQANGMPFGWQRDVALVFATPVRWVSHLTRLDQPRRAIISATGGDPDAGSGEVEEVEVVTPVTAATPVTLLRPATAAAPLRLWVGGDSMAQEFGARVVERAGERPTLAADELDYRISTGLTRPDFFNWPVHLRDEVLPTRPEVMVVIFGANDGQPMEVDGTPYEVRTPQWQAEYRRRVASVMDQLSAEGRLVVWVGQPRMRDAEFDERMQILDEIYESEAASRPWIRFLDSRPVLAGPDGGYAAYLTDESGEQQLARQSDGIHLSRYGADLLADAVFATIDEEVEAAGGAVAPAPTSSTTTTGPPDGD